MMSYACVRARACMRMHVHVGGVHPLTIPHPHPPTPHCLTTPQPHPPTPHPPGGTLESFKIQ